MKTYVRILFVLMSAWGYVSSADAIEVEKANVVGFSNCEVHKGRNMIAVQFQGVGGAATNVGALLGGCCDGDVLSFGDFKATARLAEDELHWYSEDGVVVDGAKLPAKGAVITIDRIQNKTTNVMFVGETDVVNVQETKSSKPRRAESDSVKRIENPTLYLADYLSYSTVRIENRRGDGSGNTGTGFFFMFYCKTNASITVPAIVSNRHVTEGVQETTLTFTVKNDGRPSARLVKYHTQYPPWQKWIMHPDADADLSVLPLLPIVNQIKAECGLEVFYMPFDSKMIPDDKYFYSLTQLDEVAMIGYPNGLWDEVNNQPIFRKGAIATRPSISYNGRREFLVDMSVFPGSSGSPILLVSEGPFYDRQQNSSKSGTRLALLGINHATLLNDVVGDVVVQTAGVRTFHRQPNNLGIIIHASRLREMEDVVSQFFFGQ